MAGLFFVQKWRFFFKHLPILQKQLRKKICFCSSFKFAVVLVRAAKKHAAGKWLQCRHFEIFVNDKISLET